MNRIIIAAHKSYAFPTDDLYLPLQVGAKGKKDILNLASVHLKDNRAYGETIARDDTGENISEKNPGYCELTGLYWAWKNLTDADVIGLVHYRRHFTAKSLVFRHGHEPLRSVLTEGELSALLLEYDILVPSKRVYGIETLYSHYCHTLHGHQLDVAREVISEKTPEYLPFFDALCKRRWGYMFNMMILHRRDLEEYCGWLFDILFAVEERLSGEGYLDGLSEFEQRLFGRVSEILFNAWVEKQRRAGRRIGEVSLLPIEPEDWPRKIKAFLAAKFKNRKYEASF